MKTNDELIAEFMGYWYEKPKGMDFTYLFLIRDKGTDVERKDTLCTIGNERFDTSWDWLMPVVEKIESLGHHVAIETGFVEIGDDSVPVSIFAEEGDTKILIVYLAVVEFIEWYQGERNGGKNGAEQTKIK